MQGQRAERATPEAMSSFHTDEYVHFLARVTPDTAEELTYNGTRCKLYLGRDYINLLSSTSQFLLGMTIRLSKGCLSFALFLQVAP